jgi:uncharacterized membrane protein
MIGKRGILHPFKQDHHRLTFGQRAADKLTKWAGSWTFILIFLFFLFAWVILNVCGWINQWDEYPFILLNLILSCIAATQAPIILMSQNREAQIDRQRSEYDYMVNRKAEKEIEKLMEQMNRIEKLIQKKF